jgi:acyl-CoA thioester hydrolase
MEEARIELMDRMGFPYIKMEEEGIIVPVKSLRVDYLKPCTFGDEVEIETHITDFNGVVITMSYEMRVKDESVCKAASEHVFLDRNGKFVRMKRVMPEFCAAVEKETGA